MRNNKERNSYEVLSCFSRGHSRKRGQVFALGLFLITLFMCGMVWVLYGVEQKNADSSLVSPRAVLEMRDDLEIFEIREKALVEFLVVDIDGEFGSDEFIDEFRERFLNGTIENEKMSEFIFKDLVFEGRSHKVALEDRMEFLSDNLYSDFVNREGKLFFSRNKMGKKVSLRARGGDEVKNKFPVVFVYEFAQDYTVTKNEDVS